MNNLLVWGVKRNNNIKQKNKQKSIPQKVMNLKVLELPQEFKSKNGKSHIGSARSYNGGVIDVI
jgi:hypothetical protein